MAKFQSVQGLLTQASGKYHELFREGQRLLKANRILQDMLSKPLNQHARISQITADTLHIAVDSAAWLPRAKSQVTDIFGDFKQKSGMSQLTRTKFKVHPYLSYAEKSTTVPSKNTPVKNTAKPPATKTLSQMEEATANMQDPELKKAFEHLARTLKSRD